MMRPEHEQELREIARILPPDDGRRLRDLVDKIREEQHERMLTALINAATKEKPR